MLEISPVLSEKFSQPSYVPATVNFTVGGKSVNELAEGHGTSAEADARRYTKFDRTACNAGSTKDFTFDDFLDLINPLEHIPGISSVFRAMHEGSIHPVSRVAGDILYGGVLGLGSAVFGGIGAVVDSVSEAGNGQDAAGLVLTALLPEETPSTIAVARTELVSNSQRAIDASASASAQTLAAMLQSSAPQSSAPDLQVMTSSQKPSLFPSRAVAENAQPVSMHGDSKEETFNGNKLPYGGVMAPVVGGTTQAQALALSKTAQSMRMGSKIYTALPSHHSLVSPEITPQTTVAQSSSYNGERPHDNDGTVPQASGASLSATKHNPLPQALVQDLMAMQAVRQYQSVAAGKRNGFMN